jgi:hypothetical protein
VNVDFRTTPLYWLVTVLMWAVILSALVGAAIPLVLSIPIAVMFCDGCNGPGDMVHMLFAWRGIPVAIILGTGAVAMFVWHAARWPDVIMAPLILLGVIAGSAPDTIHQWYWWLGL